MSTSPSRPRRGLSAIQDRILERGRSSGRLGALLAWSVVYADIGTSIYYVPGILFHDLGERTPSPAAAFVLATGLAFILLSLKYVDVSARYPDGGGVVSVASDAFGPMVGCLGGVLICVDYFLTGAISSVSAFQYLAGLFPSFDHLVVPLSCAALVLLGLLNYVGIRESASLTAVLAFASLAVNLTVATTVAVQLDAQQWSAVWAQFEAIRGLGTWPTLVGFGGAWLAFSGLESISQIAPALAEPRERTAFRAMVGVVCAVLITSPFITAFETALLAVHKVEPDRFLYELGTVFGPRSLQVGIVLTATALLLGAANTAIIGCYHVFLALVRLGFMPSWLAGRSRRFNTPLRAIVIACVVPVLVLMVTRGQTFILGEMYAFGLLGAFTLTTVGLDRIRWQERKRGVGFILGLITSVLVVAAWGTNLVHKHLSTVFGGGITLVGMGLAIAVRRGWIGGARSGIVSAETAEREASQLPSAVEILTLDEVADVRAMYRATTLVALRSPNARLLEEAVARARGGGDTSIYLLYVDEIPGLFFPPKTGPSHDAQSVLSIAAESVTAAGLTAIPVWRMAHDAGASVAGAARRLEVDAVMVGTSQRGAVWHLLRGNVLRSLVRDLPQATRLWIVN